MTIKDADFTNVRISLVNKHRLEQVGIYGDSHNSIIGKLLDKHEASLKKDKEAHCFIE